MELKNDIQVRGTLKSVDQYLNIKLDDISVVNEISYPHLVRYPDLYSLSCCTGDGVFRRHWFPGYWEGVRMRVRCPGWDVLTMK